MTIPPPSITVSFPNGGESWQRGTTKAITWSSTGSPGSNVKIELYKGGSFNRTIISSTTNDGSYNWAILSSQTTGSDYKVRVTSTSNASYTDESNANFSITAAPSITVSSPNGGESWRRGTTKAITWSSTGSPGSNVKIELYKGGSLNRTIISSTTNDGSYSWPISSSQTTGSDYKVRVTSTSNASYTDESNSNFSITAADTVATPTFTPDGGTYPLAQTVTIGTATAGATIRYTTDDSTPTPTNGTVISSGGTVNVPSSLTLKAIAYKSGLTNSNVKSATYVIGPPSGASEKIFFRSDRSGNADIWMINPNGTGLAQVTTDPSNDYAPAISPDGTRVAFSSQRTGGGDIYVLVIATGQLIRVTSDAADEANPTWSPDSSELAFVRYDGSYQRVWRVPATGGTATMVSLTTPSGSDITPDWSPAGNEIIVQSEKGSVATWNIRKLLLSSGTETVVIPRFGYNEVEPTYSPDGAQIAWTHCGSSASCPKGDIWIADSDGNNRVAVTSDNERYNGVDWSPDGSQFVFGRLASPGNSDLGVMNANGTGFTLLLSDSFNDTSPSWGVIATSQTFSDVLPSHRDYMYIEALADNGIATGCGGGKFCPGQVATRETLAIWLIQARYNGSYAGTATGLMYNDVGASDFGAAFIEQLSTDGITEGCGPGDYCPQQVVTKGELAKLLLLAQDSNATPPAATGQVYSDVGPSDFNAAWIEYLAAQGYAEGCDASNYCPDSVITRAGFARSLAKTFNLAP